MSKNLRYKIIIVAVVLIASLWALFPTFRVLTMSPEQRAALEVSEPEKYDRLIGKSIKPGLDLKGGMYLVLEVDDSQLGEDERVDVVDRALQVIRNRIDQFGVSEPDIKREGQKRIVVQLPGLQDADRAKRLIGQTAMLEWRLVRQQQEVVPVLTEIDEALARSLGDSILEVEPPADETAIAAPDSGGQEEAAPAQTDSTVPSPPSLETPQLGETPETPLGEVPMRAADKDKPFTSLLLSFYRDWLVVAEENVPRVRAMLARPEVQAAIPKDSEFFFFDEPLTLPEGGRAKYLFLVARDEMVSGSNLETAVAQSDPDSPNQLIVSFQFNRKGGRELARFTGQNVGRFTAIILDGRIRSYPVIRSKIPDGRGYIEGSFTDEEARDLSVILRAGALPADLVPREERSVGPSLGADSIRMGVRAAVLGLAVVVVFMIIYYGLSGVIASLALLFNLVILFGALAYLGAALTLPGIAGIILTIGMAIDANVLIFERIREELKKEKTIRSSIDAGYDRAFTTIFDANLTTLITAVVLWQFGTGPIKGFATTLSIGIIASMFTALVFSRVIFDLWTRRGTITKLSI
ncbi:MAG: protein translocase subunit SecD [Candidatus Krumholzibacteria bacterium]|nr:protein translocase subunit SecD [Candidatus Krumholzibacteria bacterium]